MEGPPVRRKKSASERREQRLRADARSLQRILKGLYSTATHRGSQLTKVGRSLLEVIQRDSATTPPPTHAPDKSSSTNSVPSPASTLPSVLARRVPRVASCLEEHGPVKSSDSVPSPASTLPSVLVRKVPRMASCLEENGPDTSSSDSVPSPASTLPSVLAGSGSYLAAAPKRNYATFVPGACTHPNVAKVDEFVDRLVRSSTTTPTVSTLVLQKKVRSSDISQPTPANTEDMDYKSDLEQMMPTDDGLQAARRPLPDASRPSIPPSAAEEDDSKVLTGQNARQFLDEPLFPPLLGEFSRPTQALVGGNSASSDEAALSEAVSSRSSSPSIMPMPDSVYDESDDDDIFMVPDSHKGCSSDEDALLEAGSPTMPLLHTRSDFGNAGSSTDGLMQPMDAALNTNANADLGMIAQLVSELAVEKEALAVHVASSSQRQAAVMEQHVETISMLRKELDRCRSQLAANEPVLQMMAEQLQMLSKQ